MSKDELPPLLPLAPAGLHILLALAAEDMHGYGIMQEVLRQSDGQYRLMPGTLYDNLQKLVRDGLIEEIKNDPESRRRCYRLTTTGRRVLAAELDRLEAVIATGRAAMASWRPRRV